jgi:hypothetical protein
MPIAGYTLPMQPRPPAPASTAPAPAPRPNYGSVDPAPGASSGFISNLSATSPGSGGYQSVAPLNGTFASLGQPLAPNAPPPTGIQNNYTLRPTIQTAATQPPTAQAATLGAAAQARAEQIAMTDPAMAAQAAGPTMWDIQQAQYRGYDPTLAAHTNVNPNAAYNYDPAMAQAAVIDPAMQAQMRARQVTLADLLTGAADGSSGPSAAQALFQQNSEAARRQQLGFAAARSGGGNFGLAMREAAQNQGLLDAQFAQGSGILRAQEMQAARAQLGDVLSNTRGADLSLATNQAGFQQQTNLANQAATNNQLAQFTAARNNLLSLGYSLENATNIANAQFSNQASAFGANAFNSAQQFNTGQTNQGNQAFAGLQNQTAIANAGFGNAVNMQNATIAANRAAQQAQLGTQVGISNAGFTNQNQIAGAGFQQGANLANLNAALTYRGQNIQQQIAEASRQQGNNSSAWGTIGALGGAAVGGILAGSLTGGLGAGAGAYLGSQIGGQAGGGLGASDTGSFGWW